MDWRELNEIFARALEADALDLWFVWSRWFYSAVILLRVSTLKLGLISLWIWALYHLNFLHTWFLFWEVWWWMHIVWHWFGDLIRHSVSAHFWIFTYYRLPRLLIIFFWLWLSMSRVSGVLIGFFMTNYQLIWFNYFYALTLRIYFLRTIILRRRRLISIAEGLADAFDWHKIFL